MYPQKRLFISPHAFPESLTNRNSNLLNILTSVGIVKETAPREVFIPLVKQAQAMILAECPQYRRFQGENWTTLCNSGANGKYFRGVNTCSKCVALCADNAPTKKAIPASTFIPTAEIVAAASVQVPVNFPFFDEEVMKGWAL